MFISGHSMGGRTALLLSLLDPAIIDQLVVVDSSPIHRTTDKGIKYIETFKDRHESSYKTKYGKSKYENVS